VLIKNKKNFAGNWRTSTGELLGENSESLRITPIKNITLYFNYNINSGCTNSDTLSIEIQPRANPFIEKTIKVCEGDTLGLDFGNDWSQNTLYNTSYLFVQSDIRIYNYIIHESDTLIYRQVNKSGCTSKDSLIIEMTPLPEFTVSTQEFYCSDSNTEIKIETSPENTVFLEGNPVFGSVNFQIHQDSILNFTNQSPEGCLSAKSVDLHVYPRPTGILPDSLRACPDEILQLFTESKNTVWTTVHGDTLHVGNLLSYPFQSEITIVANYPDNYGCIVVEPLLIRSKGTFDPNLSYLEICPGEIPILPSWNNVHFWKDLQTGKIFQGKDLQPPLTENRLFELSLQDLSGCTIKDTLEIRINNKIGLELPKSITFCTDQNQTLQLDNKLWSSVIWKLDTRVEEGNQLNLAKKETGKIQVSAVNLSGCRVAYTIPVFDYSDTKIILSGPKKGCIGDTVVIQASGVAVQNWYLENGAMISQDSLHFQFAIDSTTQLIASSISGGCMTADTIRIESMKLPGLDIPNTVDICENTPKWIKIENSEYLLQWYNSDNQLLSNTDSLYVVPEKSETYWIESFTTEGCIKVDTLQININPSPITETSNDKIVCGLETSLQAFYNPDYRYQWIFNNEKIVGESPTLSGNLVSGNYHLIVSDSMGCFTRDTVRLFDFNSINPDKNEFLEVCKGDWINLQPLTTPLYEKLDQLFHFKWFSDEKILSNGKNLVLAVLQNQKISYQFSSEGCLSDTITYEIKISPLPTFDLDSLLVTGYQETITPNITSSENLSFYWSPGLFLSSTSAKTPQITPDYSLKYQVRAKNEFGCSLSKSLQINVKNRLFIPNTFTPNEDGKNDLFKIYGNGIQSLHFIIVNEAGVPVFESTHPNQIFNEGWNGHFRGKPLKPGLYRWFIKGTFTDGSPLTYQNHTTGLIRLIR
ncbi:MAG: gliding motility-associated C-terminal domain-containing protein, partial [Cyclobacteriaceae bacterium]|nr:gliding motility-associated C-terminal domain-containing protein [Cyclobacteriaceae bacterium]